MVLGPSGRLASRPWHYSDYRRIGRRKPAGANVGGVTSLNSYVAPVRGSAQAVPSSWSLLLRPGSEPGCFAPVLGRHRVRGFFVRGQIVPRIFVGRSLASPMVQRDKHVVPDNDVVVFEV